MQSSTVWDSDSRICATKPSAL